MTSVLQNLYRHRNLLYQLTQRDILSRFKGSYFGVIWTLIQPLIMLAVYSFVYTAIFKVKWGKGDNITNLDFAMVIFAGLIVFQIFSEPMYRATNLLSSNSNFVKKVVFPLEILPTSSVLSSLILNSSSIVIMILALIYFNYPIGWHLLLIPIILMPLILFTTGMSYIITTLGVYFKDLAQAMGIIMNVLFYLSPIFYPIAAVPEQFQSYMHYNPMTFFVEAFRAVLIYNSNPDWIGYLVIWLVSIVVFAAGCFIFNYSKESFSDVI